MTVVEAGNSFLASRRCGASKAQKEMKRRKERESGGERLTAPSPPQSFDWHGAPALSLLSRGPAGMRFVGTTVFCHDCRHAHASSERRTSSVEAALRQRPAGRALTAHIIIERDRQLFV